MRAHVRADWNGGLVSINMNPGLAAVTLLHAIPMSSIGAVAAPRLLRGVLVMWSIQPNAHSRPALQVLVSHDFRLIGQVAQEIYEVNKVRIAKCISSLLPCCALLSALP